MSRIFSTPPPTPQAAANPWLTHTVEITAIRQEVPAVATYELAFRDAAMQRAYEFAPGQFNMLYLPGAGEIAISVSGDSLKREVLSHTVRVAGNVTRTLAGLKVGETLGLRGPFGTSWPLAEAVGHDVILVAGGIGLAPLRPAIYRMLSERNHFGRLHLLYGARTPDTLLYLQEAERWKQQGLTVHTTVDRSASGWQGNVGVVTQLLERLADFDPRKTVLMCCGPEVMMKFTIMTALHRGLQARQVWISMERNMQCAVGLCGHCQFGPEFICKDGPVFRYDRVAPFMDIEGL